MQQPPEDQQATEQHSRPGSDRPIFVVGCPRSGTTLLQLMLSAHPRIAIPPETRFLLPAYERRVEFGDLRQRSRRVALADWVSDQKQTKDLHLPRKLLRRRMREAPATLGSALGSVYREYAVRLDKPRWGDKRPLYVNHIPTLLALFPDAQFVHIIRDGRDCVASMLQVPWWHTGPTGATSRWIQSMQMGARARRSLRGDQYHELQYEHLVTDPGAVLRRLCGFLDEDFSEAMMEPHRTAPAPTPKRKVWHSRTRDSVSAASVSQWTDRVDPGDVAVLDLLGRRHLRRYGYERATNVGAPPPDRALKAARHLARREAARYRDLWQERARKQQYGFPVAAQLTSGQIRLATANGERQWALEAQSAEGPRRR